MARTRVFFVDDNRMLAEAMRRRIGRESDLEWAGYADQDADILNAAVEASADVLMLDIDLPGLNSFELAKRLSSAAPLMHVVMFSGHLRPEYLDLALDAGTWGYVSKNDSMEEIIDSVRRAAAGQFVMTSDVKSCCLRK